jgi:hypothetical protein
MRMLSDVAECSRNPVPGRCLNLTTDLWWENGFPVAPLALPGGRGVERTKRTNGRRGIGVPLHRVDAFWTETHHEAGMPELMYEEYFVRCSCEEVFISRHSAAVRAFQRQHAAGKVQHMHEVGNLPLN